MTQTRSYKGCKLSYKGGTQTDTTKLTRLYTVTVGNVTYHVHDDTMTVGNVTYHVHDDTMTVGNVTYHVHDDTMTVGNVRLGWDFLAPKFLQTALLTRIGYATEGALFILAHLSTDAVSALRGINKTV